jgi:hypothetical protein
MNATLALAHFRLRDWFGNEVTGDPCWWPEGVGRALTDWGLLEAADPAWERRVAASLGLSQDPPGPHPFDSFRGSVGSESDACRYWVLLESPPRRETDAAVRLRLPRWLNALGIAPRTHVTSVLKMRGGLPPVAPAALRADLATVLAEEWTAVPARRVLCAPGARDAVRRLLADAAVSDDVRSDLADLLRADFVEGTFPHDVHVRGWDAALEAWRTAVFPDDLPARTR